MRFNKFLFALLAMLFMLNARAVDEVRNSRLDGGNMVAGKVVSIKDDKFSVPYVASWLNPFANIKLNNKIEFGLNEDKHVGYNQDFSVEITFNVTTTDIYNNVQLLNNQKLKIDYKQAGAYKDKAQLLLQGFAKLDVTIVSIVAKDASNAIITGRNNTDLFLEAEIATERNYLFFQNQAPNASVTSINNNIISTCDQGESELEIYWDYVPGAEEYELEWTWVNAYPGSLGEYDFKFDATRILTKNTFYRIPLLYEQGTILYRLRHIGRGGVNFTQRVEGPWTNFPEKGLASNYPSNLKFSVNPYIADVINWSATMTFDENGRKGFGASFMDGMLMGRQSIAKLNTDNKIIAQSVIYDYQGRPAISILPAPTNDNCFVIQNSLNSNNSNGVYNETNFDDDASCVASVDPISVANGSSYYYSSANTNKEGAQGNLPVADGLPFVQVEYMDDMTGRIKSQTMPGKAHEMGSGKETNFFYSNPGSSELLQLFGSEVGDVSHYDKNIVKDANGQLSASYIDMEGRVIATALLGQKPTNVDGIEDYNSALPQVDNLALSNIADYNNFVLSSSKNIFIETAGDVQTFEYELTPFDYTNNCAPGFCYDCIYELEISITDDCHNNITPAQTYVIGKILPATQFVLDNCDAPSVNFAITPNPLPVTFPKIGNYVVTKTLKISDVNLDEYVASYIANNTCFKSYAQILAEQTASIDASTCNNDCQSCLTSVSSYTNANPGLSAEVIAGLVADCEVLCANEIDPCFAARTTMLQDFAPGGQYALYTNTGGVYSSTDNTSIFASPNFIGVSWNTAGLVFKDEFGALATVSVIRSGSPVLLAPGLLTLNEFVDHFKPSWAKTFLAYHPEKCYLDFCELNATSEKYDYGMLQVNSYDEAYQKGYLKPMTGVTLPVGLCPNTSAATNFDPFFASGGQGSINLPVTSINSNFGNNMNDFNGNPIAGSVAQNYTSLMNLALTNHYPASIPNTFVSGVPNLNVDMYQLARELVFGGTNYPMGCDPCTKDQEWLMFRALYQGLKLRMVSQRKTDYVIANGCFNGCMASSGLQPFYKNDADANANSVLSATTLKFIPYNSPVPFISNPSNTTYYSFTGYPILKSPSLSGTNPLLHNGFLNLVITNSNPYNSLSPCSNIANGAFNIKVAHFTQIPLNPTDLLAQAAADPNAPGPGVFTNPPPANATSNYCNNTCASYADGWIEKLVPCNPNLDINLSTYDAVLANKLKAGLISVCVKGCDPQNPFGSSTTPGPVAGSPSAPSSFVSFDQVLTFFGLNPSIASCNALVLDFPEPYGHDYSGSASQNKLDTCGCNKILKTKTQFIALSSANTLPAGVTSIEKYFEYLWNTPIANFNDLACKCEAVSGLWSTNYPWTQAQSNSLLTLNIPVSDVLACTKCLPCTTIVAAVNSFNTAHPTWLSAPDYKDLLSNSLNASLNMNMDGDEYLDFYSNCLNGGTNGQCSSASAATQMQALLNTYITILQNNAAPFSINFSASSFPGLFGACLVNCTNPVVPVGVKITVSLLSGSGLPDYEHPIFSYYGGFGDCKDFNCNLNFNGLNAILNPAFGASNITVSSVSFITTPGAVYNVHPTLQYSQGAALITNNSLNINYSCLNTNFNSAPVPPSLCNKPFTPTVPIYDDCLSSMLNQAQANALALYNSYVVQYTAQFKKDYKDKCIRNAKEKYQRTYTLNEYHYTLYYYDQAGNLTRTVPPKGVELLPAAQVAQLQSATPPVIFPGHTYVTNYQYQSYGAPANAKTPDEDGVTKYIYDAIGRIQVSQNAKQNFVNEYSYTLYDELGRIKEVGTLANNPITVTLASLAIRVKNGTFESFISPPVGTTVKKEVIKTYYDKSLNNAIAGQFGGNFVLGFLQINLRNRVATVTFENQDDNNPNTFTYATHYTYDEHGNVDKLIQDVPGLQALGKQYTKIDYNYDLISGNVNKVTYQKNQPDQFMHKYEYDNDNRLHNVYTSKDGTNWDKDAKYFYYEHGPLARTELGDQKVQGTDFAYTIHGWIKAVNSNILSETADMGKDGAQGNEYLTNYNNIHQFVATDAAGYSLNYYQQGVTKDYQAIKASNFNAGSNRNMLASTGLLTSGSQFNLTTDAPDLFNGNISSMVTSIYDIDIDPNNTHAQGTAFPQITAYRYDQLHRIMQMKAFRDINPATNAWNAATATNYDGSYFTQFTYDQNGNIKTQRRDGAAFVTNKGLVMDDMIYKTDDASLTLPNNKLIGVNDAAGGNYTNDIKGLSAAVSGLPLTYDYSYDKIGNLIADKKEFILTIDWTVDRKVKRIIRDGAAMALASKNMPDLEFEYDANRQRIAKIIKPRVLGTGALETQDKWTTTYYLRDASGNIVATYQLAYAPVVGQINTYNETITLQEHDMYGSARLGTIPTNQLLSTRKFTATLSGGVFTNKVYPTVPLGPFTPPCGSMINVNINGFPITAVCPQFTDRVLGNKRFELSSHLQNVISVVSDRKTQLTGNLSGMRNEFEQPFAGQATPPLPMNTGKACKLNNLNVAFAPVLSVPVNAGDVVIASANYLYTTAGAQGILIIRFVDAYGNYIQALPVGTQYYGYNTTGALGSVQTINTANITVPTPAGYTGQIYAQSLLWNPNNNDVWFDNHTLNVSYASATVVQYKPEILETHDYFAFGMAMPGRKFTSSSTYRYGYQGSEKDNEISGEGNTYTTHYRGLDVRLGRWWSTDPKEDLMPWQSPYVSMDNNPILLNDPDGDCPWCITAAIGGLISGGIELGGQLLANGGDFDKVDWVDVAGETVKGAVIGSGAGLVATVFTEVAVNTVKAGFDYSAEGGNQNVFNGKKTVKSAAIDYAIDVGGGKLIDGAAKFLKKPLVKVTNAAKIELKIAISTEKKAIQNANKQLRSTAKNIAKKQVNQAVAQKATATAYRAVVKKSLVDYTNKVVNKKGVDIINEAVENKASEKVKKVAKSEEATTIPGSF